MFAVPFIKLILLVLRGIDSDAKLPSAGPSWNPDSVNVSREELL